jgi:hypothetical protein
MGAHSVWLPGAEAACEVLAQPRRGILPPGLTAGPPCLKRAPPHLLSAFGLRAVGKVVAGVEMLECSPNGRPSARGC